MRKALLFGVAAAAIAVGGSANGQQRGVVGLACFYECKERNAQIWDEITTLMVTNPTSSPARGQILFLDGNENLVAVTDIDLSPLDLDEINVCRTLEASGAELPQAGLIILTAGPSNGQEEAFVVDERQPLAVWVKNLLGTFNKSVDEPFDGNVQGIAKTTCQQAQAPLLRVDEQLLADPILVEDTFEEEAPPPR